MKNIKKILKKVDFVLSFGGACRPAYYTKLLGLRKFSSPCDWMYNYALEDYIEVLQTNAQQMFRVTETDAQKKGVIDKQNGMISLHDFDCNQPLEEQLPEFYAKMTRRAKNTNEQLKKRRHVGIIMNRELQQQDILRFSKTLREMYPKCSFHILNIWDTPQETTVFVDYQLRDKKNTITQICFNDGNKNGRDPAKNPRFWLGNEDIWPEILLKAFCIKGEKIERIKNKLKKSIAKRMNGVKCCISSMKRVLRG